MANYNSFYTPPGVVGRGGDGVRVGGWGWSVFQDTMITWVLGKQKGLAWKIAYFSIERENNNIEERGGLTENLLIP